MPIHMVVVVVVCVCGGGGDKGGQNEWRSLKEW